MSFDWIGKTLFFVDGHKRTIELVRTDITYSGRMRKTILAKNKLKKPRGIVVNPNRGKKLYYFIAPILLNRIHDDFRNSLLF